MQLDVFDPAMCCSTGVCGPEIDSQLVQFAADVQWLAAQGITVRRYNLSQEPTAFSASPLVRRTLQSEGIACLPLGIVDGTVIFRGGYPTRDTLLTLLALPAGGR